MAGRVVLHVGLPKTGTTYLQSIAWANKQALRDQGVRVPGLGPRQHQWASSVVRQEQGIDRRHRDAHRAWAELTREAAEWPGTVLISHEFFAGASEEQVRRALADLGNAEVHVVVSAREIVGLVTARWQEWVKNGATGPIDSYPPGEGGDPGDEWGWDTNDLAGVLRRWGSTLPPAQVHLVTLPGRDEPKDALWRRFAGLLEIDPDTADTTASQPNESLGVVEVELLRRINPHLGEFSAPVDKGVWIRGYLAQEKLVPRNGERFWSPSCGSGARRAWPRSRPRATTWSAPSTCSARPPSSSRAATPTPSRTPSWSRQRPGRSRRCWSTYAASGAGCAPPTAPWRGPGPPSAAA